MRRYLQTLSLFWNTSVAAEMEYRLNFILAALTSLGNLVGSIFGLFLFYRKGTNLGGWHWHEALLVMGFAVFMEGYSSTFLRPNVGRIVKHVREGTLDFVLLKPIDTQFWLSTRNLSIWGMPNMGYGVLVVAYAGTKLDMSARDFAAGALPFLLGLCILYSIWFLLSAASIWFVKVHNVTGVLRSVLEAGHYPIQAYPAAYRFFFTFIIPVAFLTTVPASTMLARSGWVSLAAASVLAVALFAAARLFWSVALRFYTSASS